MRLSLHQAENDRRLLLFGQATDFLFDDRHGFTIGRIIGRRSRRGNVRAGWPLAGPSSYGVGSGSAGDTERDSEKPVGKTVPIAQLRGLAQQDQERRLEGVFDVVGIIEPAAAVAENHRAVPCDQFRKSGLVAVEEEPLQELALAEATQCPVA